MKVLLPRKSIPVPDVRKRALRRPPNQPGKSTQSRLLTTIWVQVVLGLISATLLVLTILLPDWMEVLFGFAPDAGDGSAEWGLALSWATVSVLMFGFAGRTWRKHIRLLREV
jgi:hypothetical protein